MFAKSDGIFKRRQQECPQCRKVIPFDYIEQNPFPEFPCPNCGTLIDSALLHSVEFAGPNERREERLNAAIQVSYNSYDEFITEYTKNVSQGGIFISTRRNHEIGQSIELSLIVPDLDKPLRILGEVIHINSHNVPDDQAGIGVKFLDIDPESRAAVIGFIKSRTF
jgi:uncharacterized protein (TIGR02266 family)